MAEPIVGGRRYAAWDASASTQLADPVQCDLNLMDVTRYPHNPPAIWSLPWVSNLMGTREGIPIPLSASAYECA